MSNTLKRNLLPRHLIMIALGGSIGTGLFLASGSSIAIAGPAGALLAYVLIAIMVYFLMSSLGEMAAFRPTTGSFCEYSTKYVSPEFGFAMGWNYWFSWAITIAAEITAASLVMQFWYPGVNIIIWSVIFFVAIFALNMFAVHVYGETEYWLSFVKVSAVVIFIVVGTLAIFGLIGTKEAVGFQNWQISGGPFHHGFTGFMAVFLVAGFSFQGTELIGVAAGEAREPQKAIPLAVKKTFWRLFIFYVLAIGVISFLIPFNSPTLISSNSDSTTSPFTQILSNAGFASAATIMNIVVLVAILSAANASMYSATRIMWNLAKSNHAPKTLEYVNKRGLPIAALIITAAIGSLFFLTSLLGNGTVFIWLVNISSLSGFIAWFGIALSHYRFRNAFYAQNRDLNELPYRSKWFPIAPIIAMILILLIIFGQEYESLTSGSMGIEKFLATYLGVFTFIGLIIGYRLIKKTKTIPLEDCDLTKIEH
ncbi:amino acid permease [Shewanella sp. 202IG2-18]|uniref:amino acid permease n=1 Tax=Parashewanella hymeniacidonis TaxID=2807618 RepID=UPI0019605C51|nr:amino acid permease [Parashewanella hymeniacidonis]MBM7072481.1 amino acid permease [Parashewanella hymeniacidonis]